MISDFRDVKQKFLQSMCMALALIGSAQAQNTDPKSPLVVDDPIYTHAQHLVEVEAGRKLNLYCIGTGSPTVIFETGAGDDLSAWGLVQPIVAAKTRACAYDRAGYGFSDAMRRPNTAVNYVDDLHHLLAAASIKPPYILVGHSMGGMYVRLYADLYPSEVAGLVLVAPSNEEQRIRYTNISDHPCTPAECAATREAHYAKERECIAAAPAGFTPDTPLYKQCVDDRPDPHFSEVLNKASLQRSLQVTYMEASLSEEENMLEASANQVRAARRSYGDLPLILLAAPQPARHPNESQRHYDEAGPLQIAMDQELVSLSTRGVYRLVPNTTHQILLDQPQAVGDAVLEVIARTKR